MANNVDKYPTITITNTGSREPKSTTPTLFYYPNTIRQDEFKLRKVTLSIYKSRTFASTFDEIKSKVSEGTSQLIQDVATADNYKETIYAIWESDAVSKTYNQLKNDLGADFEYQIVLPLPNEVSDSIAHEYSIDNGIVGSIAENSSAIKTLQESIGAKLANATGTQKVMMNPEFYQNYTGSRPREINFTFNLIPNNKEEAESIFSLIILLKKMSSPELTRALFLTQPRFFHIQFGNEKLQRMINPLPCVLKQVDTNYSASGYIETTLDGSPKFIALTLTFAEIKAHEFAEW